MLYFIKHKMKSKIDHVIAKIDKLIESHSDVRVKVAGIESHLKSINGSINRHETILNIHEEKINNNKMDIIKGMSYGGGAGGLVYLIIFIINKNFDKCFCIYRK